MTNVQQKNALHKKRFGQFFSGKIVADLLFSLLPKGINLQTVVDPMAGIGDMLKAVKEHSSSDIRMLGIEIDTAVAKECAERIPNAIIKNEDAFQNRDLITKKGWDLVITNPPYVRYQLQSGDDEGVMPTGQEIRDNLIQQIERITYLSKSEKELFFKISKGYSGLADMAVPAWILCAALVKKGGYLAIVVPETWLNRDYASPIQYLLNKLFCIQTIAKDTNASWFPEALINTCLVIAQRKEISLIQDLEDQETTIIEFDRIYEQKTGTIFPHMLAGKSVSKWILDEDRTLIGKKNELPYELNNLIGTKSVVDYFLFPDMGVNVGQGLRTGANDFFYVTVLQDDSDHLVVKSRVWDHGGKEYQVRKDEIILTLQNRSNVEGIVVRQSDLKTGVIYLTREADGKLKDYITSGEKNRDTKGKRFKEYSAVKPNEKIVNGEIIRHWYMLPKLSNRHLPNLCMTRVSVGVPECLFIEQSKENPLVIDANMVTMWSKDERTNRTAFALLNSTWSKLYLELLCTTMGGGALKIEATHIKKLLIPKLSQSKLDRLQEAGGELIESGFITDEIQNKIDTIIFSPFDDEMIIVKARELLAQKLKERSTRYEQRST